MELLAVAGFSLFFGWMISSFYWMFTYFPPDYTPIERCLVQGFIFVGIIVGYSTIHVYTRKRKYEVVSRIPLIVGTILMMLIPAATLLSELGIIVPMAVTALFCFCSGLAYSLFITSWLDACGRSRIQSYVRVISLSLAVGTVLFLLLSLMPYFAQPVFGMAFALGSAALLDFVGTRGAQEPSAETVAQTRHEYLKFAKEVEPSFFVYGIVFGLAFVFLISHGQLAVLFGLSSIIVGALAIFIADALKKEITITIIQRILLVVTVAACLLIPFSSQEIQIACACVVVAAWAAFIATNFSLITRKSIKRGLSVFKHAPAGLIVNAVGFLVGWIIATVLLFIGFTFDVLSGLMLTMAFVLVFVVMVFYPQQAHHGMTLPEEEKESAVQATPDMTEKEIFEKRCEAVASLYQLSPREGDILRFLAKGRNAAYIQAKLTISPHTVKSHIYSIYRKLDIHSQQKLMDFVEEYPLEGERDPTD